MSTHTKHNAPRFSVGGVSLRTDALDPYQLRQAVEKNPRAFAEKIIPQIEAGKVRWEDVKNLRDLWHALRDLQVETRMEIAERSVPVMTGAFALLTGQLTVAGLNAAYEAVPEIGSQLVTDMDSNKKRMTIAGILPEGGNNLDVEEGQNFPMLGASAERYDISHRRRGFCLCISAEMVEENDLAEVISRVQAGGRIAANAIEVQTLEKVTDHHGSAASGSNYVLNLNGTGAALYRANNTAPFTRLPASTDSTGIAGNRLTNNALVDTTDLDNARLQLASVKDSIGARVSVASGELKLLVPTALEGTAVKILGSEYLPGEESSLNAWGPRGRWRPTLLSSPRLDDLSASAWYFGVFAPQFVRKWKLRLEQATMAGRDTMMFVEKRMAMMIRLAWDVEIGARDYVYVIQSLSQSTAPKDE